MRLQRFMQEVMPGEQEGQLTALLGEATGGEQRLQRSIPVRALLPLLSALALESSFLPGIFDERALGILTKRIVHTSLE